MNLAPAPGNPSGDFNTPDPIRNMDGQFRDRRLNEQNAGAGNEWPGNNNFVRDQERERLVKEETEQASHSRMIWTVVGIVGGLGTVLLIGLVLLAVLSQSGNKKKKAAARKRKRKVTRYDDDDDDDEYIPRSKRRRSDD
jgi:hypothetical protein